MGSGEDEMVEAMTALCSEKGEGGRRMLVMPTLCLQTISALERDYQTARAGDVMVVWREHGEFDDPSGCGEPTA